MAEDVASVTDGLPASGAEVGSFSAVGASVENHGGALLRISQCFCGLLDCLFSSRKAFRDVSAILELETAAGSSKHPQTSVSVEEARPELLRGVADTLQQMVGESVSKIMADAVVQKLMPAIQKASAAKHHAFFQEWMNVVKHQQSNPGSAISDREETLGCISSEDSRTGKSAARSSLVAEMAIDVSVRGTSVTLERETALLRISLALYGLVTSLYTSLEEFRDVEQKLELESAAGRSPELLQSSVSDEEPRREDLLGVASALKKMAGLLMSRIKANRQVQRLMPAIQRATETKHHAIFQDLMIDPSHQQSCSGNVISPPREETPICTFSKDSGMAQRIAITCEHSCEHHGEVLDPFLWGNLPLELAEEIPAWLPLPRLIVECLEGDKYWHTLLKTSSLFRKACSKSHPKLFGLLGWTVDRETMWTTLYDVKSKEWVSIELTGLPGTVPDCRWEPQPENDVNDAYRKSMCAGDGGLVCFVPSGDLASLPILVCNPLTSIWKALPLISVEDFEYEEIVMVQLVVEDDKKLYRVILVSRDKIGEARFSAHFYSSRFKTWSILDFGLVHGDGFIFGNGYLIPHVFNCRTKTLFRCTDYSDTKALDYSWARGHLFDVRLLPVQGTNDHRDVISEYIVLSSSSISFERVDILVDSPVQVFPYPCGLLLFASSSFVILIADNHEDWLEDHCQHIGLYDRATARWEILPPLPRRKNFHHEQLQFSLRVELRWDIDPRGDCDMLQ